MGEDLVARAVVGLLSRGWRVRLYGSEYAELEPENPREGECVVSEEDVRDLLMVYRAGFVVVLEHPRDPKCYLLMDGCRVRLVSN